MSILTEDVHRQSTLDELIRAQELQIWFSGSLLSRLITYLELHFRASKLPRAGSWAWHFLVGSWPGGGSSRPSLRPRGCLRLELKSEVSVPDALQRGRPGRMNRREGARRRLVAKAQGRFRRQRVAFPAGGAVASLPSAPLRFPVGRGCRIHRPAGPEGPQTLGVHSGAGDTPPRVPVKHRTFTPWPLETLNFGNQKEPVSTPIKEKR